MRFLRVRHGLDGDGLGGYALGDAGRGSEEDHLFQRILQLGLHLYKQLALGSLGVISKRLAQVAGRKAI